MASILISEACSSHGVHADAKLRRKRNKTKTMFANVRLSVLLVGIVLTTLPSSESFSLPTFGHISLKTLGKGRVGHVPLCMTSASGTPRALGKLLVLGATGFVGSEIARQASSKGYEVVGVSRRGADSEAAKSELGKKIDWRKGDIAEEGVVQAVLQEGGFTGVVHAVGILLEGDNNKFASGSGSVPKKGATYDVITRQTAAYAAQALADSKAPGDPALPFAFVSAAEARWDFDQNFVGTPVEWLHRYLIAKRAVEADLMDNHGKSGALRPIIVRPSLVWTWGKPASYLPVAAFMVGNKLGLPFVDKPVTVQLLARAIINALGDETVSGVLDFKGMEKVSAGKK